MQLTCESPETGVAEVWLALFFLAWRHASATTAAARTAAAPADILLARDLGASSPASTSTSSAHVFGSEADRRSVQFKYSRPDR